MKRPWDAIVWWEKRRIPFNALVCIAGIASILIIELVGSHLVRPGEDAEEPFGIIIGAVAYGIAANICYSFGWITELPWSGGDTVRTEALRPKIFRFGLLFSIARTLLPSVLVPLAWAIWGFK